jgi:hypothetical protein
MTIFDRPPGPARVPYGYRESRNTLTRMAAIRLGPQRIELAVQCWDLCQADGQVFLRKFHQALEDAPKQLVVHLSAGPPLTPAGEALLAWARADAEAQGIAFELRPAHGERPATLRGTRAKAGP